MLVDSHCHLDSTSDFKDVIKRAKSNEIDKIITVGTSIESSKKSLEIAEEYSNDDLKIYAAVGIHPQDGKEDSEKFGLDLCIHTLKEIANSSERVVGIGETGLDYRLTTDKGQLTTDKERAFQKELFREQVKLAVQLKLPLVIHCRNAFDETFDLLSNVKCQLSNVTGVFHSFTGNWQEAQKALDLGFYISFSGIITFKQSLRSSSASWRTAGLKNAKDIQEVASKMPLDRILVETDSPFLSPEPYRKDKNEPKNVRIVAQFIADLRGVSLDKIAEITSRNAEELFRLNN